MDLIPLKLKSISKIVGNDDLALLELVTNDELKQLSVVCESTMIRQFAMRLSNVPERHRLLPEVLWAAFGEGKHEDMRIIFANYHDGEYMVFLFDDTEGLQWPLRASDAVLLSLVLREKVLYFLYSYSLPTCCTKNSIRLLRKKTMKRHR